ncbi:MAG: hypothetical protein FJ271_04230 [Planctomycetes bacterium]|nr:hypothetical protein [Planctomycetota bacterium]
MDPNAQAAAAARKRVYALLITVAAGMVAGRILAAELVYEPSLNKPDKPDSTDRRRLWPKSRPQPMPSFGSNDRSRWATVRALVDGDPASGQPAGTFVIGRRDRNLMIASAIAPLAASDSLSQTALLAAGYQTRTRNDRGIIFEDGWQSVDKVLNPRTLEFFSSKPPLLSVLVAALYWLLQLVTGWTLADHPFAVMRTILLLINLLPFVVYLVLLSRLLERHGTTDWGRFFTMAAACFATYATTFAVTLNNHSLAMYCVLFALYPLVGQAAALARPGSLPESSASPVEDGTRGRLPYVAAGLFASFAACLELPATSFAAALLVFLLWRNPLRTLLFFVPAAALPLAAFLLSNYAAMHEWRPAYEKFGTHWYEYEGSHWQKPPPGQVKHGIDWAGAKESRTSYALHLLVGHHGLFSLTPLWLLSAWGMLRLSLSPGSLHLRRLAVLTLLLTVVVVGFYLVKSDNYGGWTSGLRWLMWLSPLWLLCLLPIADHLSESRGARGLGYLLLGWSILSVSYPAWNPWRHPWIYRLMEALGWQGY